MPVAGFTNPVLPDGLYLIGGYRGDSTGDGSSTGPTTFYRDVWWLLYGYRFQAEPGFALHPLVILHELVMRLVREYATARATLDRSVS